MFSASSRHVGICQARESRFTTHHQSMVNDQRLATSLKNHFIQRKSNQKFENKKLNLKNTILKWLINIEDCKPHEVLKASSCQDHYINRPDQRPLHPFRDSMFSSAEASRCAMVH